MSSRMFADSSRETIRVIRLYLFSLGKPSRHNLPRCREYFFASCVYRWKGAGE